jgi:methyl-accepting chemotaxis protein
MAVFANVKIKTFALFGVALLAALPIALSAISYSALASLDARLTFTAQNSMPSTTALAEIDGSLNDARVQMSQHIASATVEETRALDAKLEETTALIDKEITSYAPLVADDQERGVYNEVIQQWQVWKEKSAQVRALSLNMQNEAALQAYRGELQPVDEKVDQAVLAQIDYNAKLSKDNTDAGAKLADQDQFIALVAAVLAGLIAAAVALIFYRRIITPLTRIAGAMENMAAGDLDSAIPYSDQGDEIGGIARALAAIKDAVAARARIEGERRAEEQQRIVNALGAGLAGLRDGRLNCTINAAFPEEYEALRRDFNSTLESLSTVIGEVIEGAQNVRTGSSEIASAASDLSSRTENQAAALEESAAAVRQLMDSVRETAVTAGDASSVAGNARSDATTSGEMMHRAVTAIEEIARSSARMGEIVSLIEGIAFQTNLLALNAGVEAARAGDAGRGFAVVASEVRALAQRSSTAASEITGIIKTSAREVNEGVQLIAQTQSSLEQIVGHTERLTGMIQEIADSTAQQSAAIGQVNAVVGDMDRITQQNAALVEESTAASQNLSQSALNLLLLVERFDMGSGGTSAAGHQRRLAA